MRAKRILVVEDEALMAFEIMDALRNAGFEAIGPTQTVSSALVALARNTFDAALLDINMRGVPSFSVAAALRQNAVPFAFVTGHVRTWLPEEFREVPLIGKPFQEQRLLSVVRTLLGMLQTRP